MVLRGEAVGAHWIQNNGDGRTKHMIDFIMVNNRWKSAVTKCVTFVGPDIASPQNGVGRDQNNTQEDTQRGAEQKIRHGKAER